jgi:hypothetical protein
MRTVWQFGITHTANQTVLIFRKNTRKVFFNTTSMDLKSESIDAMFRETISFTFQPKAPLLRVFEVV